jgi:hypothetical protein
MTALAPHLTAFLRDRLPRERGASPHTCDAYAYTFQLLLAFAAKRLRTRPSALTLEALDVPFVLAFLDDLEATRGNSARTRNARLAAIRSFARFVEYRVPSCLQQIHGLLAIPSKKTDEKLVGYLTHEEMRRSSMLRTRARAMVSGTAPCCTWPLLLAFAFRNWSAYASMTSCCNLSPQSTCEARDARSAGCRCGKRPRRRCAPGSHYGAPAPRPSSSSMHVVDRSPETASSTSSRSMWRSPRRPQPRSRRSASLLTSSGIAVPCTRWRPRATSERSPCGSDTQAFRPPRSTCAPTRRRSSRQSTPCCRRRCDADAFALQTNCSRLFAHLVGDYAESFGTPTVA